MFGSTVLDVVIGIVFVFLLMSTLCAAVREMIEARLKTRAAYLERGIRELLQDRTGTGMARSLFTHPLIAGLYIGEYVPSPIATKLSLLALGGPLPSYIPAKSFALALLDIAARGPLTDEVSADPGGVALTVQSIRERLLNIDSVGVRRVLLTALDASQGDLMLARKSLEDWFDSGMDRVSGWYKRSSQWIILVIALVIAVAVNVDTLRLIQFLYDNEQARAVLVHGAEQVAATGLGATSATDSLRTLQGLGLPLGWHHAQLPQGAAWINRVLGWLLTAVAATLGTPFWFDVLNKVMVIRSTVKPREKSPEEFSEDRQSTRGPAEPGAEAQAPTQPTRQAPAVVELPALRVVMPRDSESEIDCCGTASEHETQDEDLPAALGGVG
jgi:hypothetical protein